MRCVMCDVICERREACRSRCGRVLRFGQRQKSVVHVLVATFRFLIMRYYDHHNRDSDDSRTKVRPSLSRRVQLGYGPLALGKLN